MSAEASIAEIQGRVRELTAQRDAANNRCVLLGGVLHDAEAKLADAQTAILALTAKTEGPQE